jgi:bifunctional non-homologous end joining protein LigD
MARKASISKKDKSTRLAEYRRKRDPQRTPEPFGGTASTSPSRPLSFVVQKHAASHLHFDFRLELDGVLKSWAVPKGPSLVAGAPRLAVEVEDHPLDYGRFEGTIPAGEYGGGTVMLWDRGTWTSHGDPHAGLREGALSFELAGTRMKGRWRLVRRTAEKASAKSGKPEWLLIKGHDRYASSEASDLRAEESVSVATGRTMAEIGSRGSGKVRTKAKRTRSSRAQASSKGDVLRLPGAVAAQAPAFIAPQLASLALAPPTGAAWLYELKLDGYRTLVMVHRGKVTCLTRNGLDWTHRFPEVTAAVAASGFNNVILDGEVVVFDADGRPDFHKLQNALKTPSAGRRGITFVAFDLLWSQGVDLRSVPLIRRKEVLAGMWSHGPASPVRYSEHVLGANPERMINEACKLGLEGIICKKSDAPYRSGRSSDWIKVKCGRDGEFAICGMTASASGRTGFGSLLLARRSRSQWQYCGRVGAGFSEEDLRSIARRVRALRRSTPSCEGVPRSAKADLWCEPKLVAEVSFAGVTNDGRLRQPVFKALREDKPSSELSEVDSIPEFTGKKRAADPAPRADKRRSSLARRQSPRLPAAERGDDAEVAGVRISHPDRHVFARPPITKLELAHYYERSAPQLLPFIAHRPLALLRCPQGAAAVDGRTSCFVQKHFREALPPGVHRRGKANEDHQLFVESTEGIVALVQRGVIEFHVWASRVEEIEKPDYLVFDLDPGPGVTWDLVREAAGFVRQLLLEAGLPSIVRTTGGKGLHVVAYLPMAIGWGDAKSLSRAIAERAVQAQPDRFVTNLAKSKRDRRIFIDYLRNGRGATSVASYSVRARPGAPVAMPISWRQLSSVESGAAFSLPSLGKRVRPLVAEWTRAMSANRPHE